MARFMCARDPAKMQKLTPLQTSNAESTISAVQAAIWQSNFVTAATILPADSAGVVNIFAFSAGGQRQERTDTGQQEDHVLCTTNPTQPMLNTMHESQTRQKRQQ